MYLATSLKVKGITGQYFDENSKSVSSSKYSKNQKNIEAVMALTDKFLYQARLGFGFADKHPKYFKLSQMFSKEKSNPIYEVALKALGGDSTDILIVMIEDAFNKQEFSSEYEKEKVAKNLEDYVRFMRYGLQCEKS
ncbi:hypothetical protein [Clostridium grantii]|uniref:hypothetical protein n=1 Tax=Clostridium grantii TaxID=40575 RepID=UPI000932D681|nr:hypothetical protein [Clostridium grantii]